MYSRKLLATVYVGVFFCIALGEVKADPIQMDAELYLERTLLLPGYSIGGVTWHQGQLWTVDQSGVLRRLDAGSGYVLETIATGYITHNNLGSNGTTLYMSYDPGGDTGFKGVIPSTPPIKTPSSGARDMAGIDGNLWYSDFDNGLIVKMTTSGSELQRITSPFGFGASGIEWDGEHLLHIAHDGNQLALIDPLNGQVDAWIDMSSIIPGIPGGLAWDGEWLYGAAFDRIYVMGVVPEPATAMLLTMGCGIIATTRFTRRRQN